MTRGNFGNMTAEEGCSRCECGSKYWERDRCVDCGTQHDPVKHDDWCVWDMGYRTECGDPAPEVRDGFRYCPQHALVYDILTEMDDRDGAVQPDPDDPEMH